MNALELKKSLLSTPGDRIQEHIDFIGMSQAELAERLGRSIPKLNELIKGKAPITKETAAKLEYVLGIEASFWLNLEKYYQEELLAIEQLEFLETCTSWVTGFPVAVLKKMKLLPNSNKKPELAESLLKFFRVASPNEWSTIYEGHSLAFKIELKHTTDPKAISAWLRIGELQANQIEVKELNTKLQEAIAHKNQAIENKKYTLEIVNQRQSELSLVKKDFDRANNLFKSKSISLAEFQKRETELKNAQIALNAAKTQLMFSSKSDAQLDHLRLSI